MDPVTQPSSKKAFSSSVCLPRVNPATGEDSSFSVPIFPPFIAFMCFQKDPGKCQEHKTCNISTCTRRTMTLTVQESSPRLLDIDHGHETSLAEDVLLV